MAERRLNKINNNNNKESILLDSDNLSNSLAKSSLQQSALVLEHESNLKQSRRLNSSLFMSNNSMISSKLSINEKNLPN